MTRVQVGFWICSCVASAPAVMGPCRSIVERAAKRVGVISGAPSRFSLRARRNTERLTCDASSAPSMADGARGAAGMPQYSSVS